MSVLVMGLVWNIEGLTSSEKLVLLAYADHASHEGTRIFPAVDTVAMKTSLSKRTVQRVTQELEKKGLLVKEGHHKSGTNMWSIPLDMGGDMVTPPGRHGDTGGVTSTTAEGDTVTPEPSLTTKESSEELGEENNIFLLCEQSLGTITQTWADELLVLEKDYPVMWIEDAFAIAKNNRAKSLKYVTTILSRWNENGKDNGYKKGGKKKKPIDTSAFDEVRKEMEHANT